MTTSNHILASLRVLPVIACAALSTGVWAQSSVTLYGLFDIGIAYEKGDGKSLTKMDGSGMHSGNRLGFRGTEDLGGGNSAFFVLESGFNSDTGSLAQGGLAFGRQSFIGLKGNWGALTAGRQYSPHWAAIDSMDPMDGIAGGAFNLMRRTVRTDNTVMYATPNLSGFTGQLAYGFGEVAGNNTANRVLGGQLAYANGPLTIKLGHHNAKNPTATDTTRNTYLGGSYDFGVVKALLGYQVEKGPGVVDANVIQLGAQVPLPAGTLMAQYLRKNDKSAANNDAQMLGIAYTYPLSKRTNLYTSALKIRHDKALIYRTKAGDGIGDREFNVGIRHKF